MTRAPRTYKGEYPPIWDLVRLNEDNARTGKQLAQQAISEGQQASLQGTVNQLRSYFLMPTGDYSRRRDIFERETSCELKRRLDSEEDKPGAFMLYWAEPIQS